MAAWQSGKVMCVPLSQASLALLTPSLSASLYNLQPQEIEKEHKLHQSSHIKTILNL